MASERSEAQLAYNIYNEFKATQEFWRPWRDRAKESIQFWRGVQWSEDDSKYLIDKGRPSLVFNKIISQIDVVTGNQTLNRFDTMPVPVEESDVPYREIMMNLLKFFKDRDNFHFLESKVFLFSILCGVGWYDLRVDYSQNPEGEIVQAWDDPLKMYPDENSVLDDYSDEQKTFKSIFMNKQGLINLYPHKKNLIEKRISFSSDDQGRSEDSSVNELLIDINRDTDFINYQAQTVRVVEKKYWKYKTQMKVYNAASGEIYDTKEIPQSEIDRIVKSRPELQVFRKQEKERWVTTMAQNVIVENRKLRHQIGESCSTPMWAYKLNREFFGLVENWKDYQREINKRRSSILSSIVKQGNGGGFFVSSKVNQDQLKKNKDIIVTKGDPRQHVMPKPMPQVPAALVQYEQYIANDMSEQGVTKSSLGIQSSANEPAKLFESKIQQANIRQSSPIDHLRLATKTHHRKLLKLAQKVYTQPRTLRILGDKMEPLFFNINTDEWNDVTKANFDIYIDESTPSVTSRQANSMMMLNLFQLMVQGGFPSTGLPWHMLVKSIDHQKRDEISEYITKFMQMQGLPVADGAPGPANQMPGAGGMPGGGLAALPDIPPSPGGIPAIPQGAM